LQGDSEARPPLIAQLSPLFLEHPMDPDEILDWRADYTFKMLKYGAIIRQISQKREAD
jgi:hypothetical protein